MRILVVLAFAGIVFSLGSALYFLMKDRQDSVRTLHALTVRISLSVVLFLFVLLAHYLGWIEPTGF